MVCLGRDLKDFQHLVDGRDTTMGEPRGAAMGLQEQSPGMGKAGGLYLGQEDRAQCLAAGETSSWLPKFAAVP